MYAAKTVSKGDKRHLATTRHAEFTMATDGSASSPGDALLGSLCACLGHYAGDYLHREQIVFSEYSVSAESELSDDRTRLAEIHVSIEFKDAVLTESQRLELSNFVTQCFIYGTLKANGPVTIGVQP